MNKKETQYGGLACPHCLEPYTLPGEHTCKPSYIELKALISDLEGRLENMQDDNVEKEKRIKELRLELQDSLNLNKLLDERLTELEAQLEEYQWRSVDNELPEKEGIYLTKYRGDGRQGLRDEIWIRTYYFGGMYSEYWTSKKPHKYTVTHWMPIPPLPKKNYMDTIKPVSFLPDCIWRRLCGTCYNLGSINRGGPCSKRCKCPETKKAKDYPGADCDDKCKKLHPQNGDFAQ